MVLEPMFPARPLGAVGPGPGPLPANMAVNFAGSDVMSRLLHAYRGLAMAGPYGPMAGLPPPPHRPPLLLRGIPQPQPHPGTIGHPGAHPGHPGHPVHPPLSPSGVRSFGAERPDARTSPGSMPMTPTSEEAASPGGGHDG